MISPFCQTRDDGADHGNANHRFTVFGEHFFVAAQFGQPVTVSNYNCTVGGAPSTTQERGVLESQRSELACP
jgi:hypothetical protein